MPISQTNATPPSERRQSVGATAPKPNSLPSHAEEALQAMAAMHAAHHEQASRTERSIDRVTAAIAAPSGWSTAPAL